MHTVPIQQLTPASEPALVSHFLALPDEDRRLRFGLVLSDDAVRRYVSSIDFEQDDVFGAFDEGLRLIGVAHLAVTADGAELGLSVSPGRRKAGIGAALMRRAQDRARNRFIDRFFVHSLSENAAMLRLARSAGMKVVVEYGEADASLELPPANGVSIAGEMVEQRIALFDYTLKTHLRTLRRVQDQIRESVSNPLH
jgi:GNAT superfamily N-acetyltransferase